MHEHDVRANLTQWVLHLFRQFNMLLLMSLASCDGCHFDTQGQNLFSHVFHVHRLATSIWQSLSHCTGHLPRRPQDCLPLHEPWP